MDENLAGSKDRLDYAQLVFLQINRICYTSANIVGQNPRDLEMIKRLNQENLSSAIAFLESLVVWKLTEETRKEYFAEKVSVHSNREKFDLVLKYLSKSGLLPAQKRFYETRQEGEASESIV